MDILRFLTCGNVDDGKSTLIGRLLYDSNALATDLKEFLESKKNIDGSINLALLTDGLKAEREQGITIDVAYKYFTTNKRKYIIADSPGHIQYTKNMVTAASNSDVAIILIDSRKGVTEQTKRHIYICFFMGIRYIAFAINKIDLVNDSKEYYEKIKNDINTLNINFEVVEFIPLSALNGDNVVHKSKNLKWYDGPTLFEFLENVQVSYDNQIQDFRFPVQYVIRPKSNEFHDFRAYAGRILCGEIRKGDKVHVLPNQSSATIKKIYKFPKEIEYATVGSSVAIEIDQDIDISRGSMLVGTRQPYISKLIEAQICWMSKNPLKERDRLILRHTTKEVKAIVTKIISKIDIEKYEEQETQNLYINDIGKIQLKLSEEIFYDPYTMNRSTGCFILIDDNNDTVAGGILLQMLEYTI